MDYMLYANVIKSIDTWQMVNTAEIDKTRDKIDSIFTTLKTKVNRDSIASIFLLKVLVYF